MGDDGSAVGADVRGFEALRGCGGRGGGVAGGFACNGVAVDSGSAAKAVYPIGGTTGVSREAGKGE